MAGEPQCGSNPWLGMDVTLLQTVDMDGVPSTNIMNRNSPFGLFVKFQICGVLKGWLTSLELPYVVKYYADQNGGPYYQEIAHKHGHLIPGQFEYGQHETYVQLPVNALPEGVYELTAVVQFLEGACSGHCHKLPMTGNNKIESVQSF